MGDKCVSVGVSVIIPTYNREMFIAESIRSVLDQTFQDYEVIVVDDGSVDNTADVVRALCCEKLRYIYQENRGRSNARNHAISVARGKYIAFLDSDDLYLKGKLELQVSLMESHPEVDMIYTSAYCIDECGEPVGHYYEASVSGRIYKDIAFFVPVTITLPTVMVRREVFEKVGYFDEAMERFEDTDMWRRISKCCVIQAVSEPTCKLRTHAGNSLSSQDANKIIKALDYYAAKIIREDGDAGFIVLRKGLSRLYQYYAYALLSQDGWRGVGGSLLFKAILCWPLSPRLYARAFYFVVMNALKKRYGGCDDKPISGVGK